MNASRRILATAPLVAIALLSACETAGRSSQAAVPSDLPADPRVESELRVLNPRTLHTGQERWLEFELQNASDSRLNFVYAIDWYERNGQPLTSIARRWTRLALEPGASRAVRIEMPIPEAESWCLRAASP